jgi:D-aminoacyl-tRNA deacylase
MRAVIQRVRRGQVSVEGRIVSSIGHGLVILLGVGPEDTEENARALARKIAMLRIFTDDQDKMNLSVLDVQGEAIVVSQFTLFADTRRGHRPSFSGRRLPTWLAPWQIASLSSYRNRAFKPKAASLALTCWSKSKMMAR